METMITVARAWTLIKEHVMTLAAVKVNLKEAGGLVLAQDIIASKDVPSFSQSNMDGYTFCFNNNTGESKMPPPMPIKPDRKPMMAPTNKEIGQLESFKSLSAVLG
jgi:molybdopterin biosynthesis enzyme